MGDFVEFEVEKLNKYRRLCVRRMAVSHIEEYGDKTTLRFINGDFITVTDGFDQVMQKLGWKTAK